MSRRDRAAGRPRRELTALLLVGAAGAGTVLLASRQEFARITVVAPDPFPATVTTVTIAHLTPAVSALAVAALASLVAVLATRGRLRRATGLVTVGLGAGIAALALSRITRAQVLDAVNRTVSPATGAGAGAAPGSVTAGGSGGGGALLSGFPAHVLVTGAGWRYLMAAGAVIVIVAGLLIVLRARRLPAMSARYDAVKTPAVTDRSAATAAAGMWESLSAGQDPTRD